MIMPGDDECSIRATGGQVDDIVIALIDTAYDKEVLVRDVVSASLQRLGSENPALVLSSCLSYLTRHSKLPQGHRVAVLKCMDAVVQGGLEKIDATLASEVIKQASIELTQSKDVVPEWQEPASKLLVAIGSRFNNEVMEELLKKFEPGYLPHFFVVQTLANLSTANVFGMVPFLHAILGTMLPMLGMAKLDNMKWVFSAALARFSEAILDYIANIEKAPDKQVKKEVFSREIDSAYDILYVWIQSRETKLRLVIVEALGYMSHIMSYDKLSEQLSRLLSTILGLYKKHQDPLHITKGLCMILEAACADRTLLEPHLDNLLGILFMQVSQPIDYSSPHSIKNHNEVLRCFAVIAGPFSDKLVGYLLQKLEPHQEKMRMASLSVIRHIINAAGNEMENKKALILSGIKPLLNDPNNKIKKILIQVVVAMAHHGYLELEGGHLFIDFIVKQSSLASDAKTQRPKDPEYVSTDALRMISDNVLQLMTSTIDDMDQVLWPSLLEYIMPSENTSAVGTLCKSITQLAEKKRSTNADDYDVDFDKEANIPKPPAIISRLVVLLGQPLSHNIQGTHILSCLKSLGPLMHDGVDQLWDSVIPKLTQYLEDSLEKDEFPYKSWEDLLLKFLSKTLDHVNDEDWTAAIAESLGKQIELYVDMSTDKHMLYKCLGIVLRKSGKREVVSKQLNNIFTTVKHSDQEQREGCAVGVGFTGTSHLDCVLTKLEAVCKQDSGKRSSGFLGFIKEQVNIKGDLDETIKATVMLCYGYSTLYAPISLIPSRLEATILHSINPHFSNIKDPSMKQNLIRAVDLIGRSMHPDHLQAAHTFTSRGDLLSHMIDYMKAETTSSVQSETRSLALEACSTLVKLEPALTETELSLLLKASLDCVVPLPEGGSGSGRSKSQKEESYEDAVEQERLMEHSLSSLQELLLDLLLQDVSSDRLFDIFTHIHPWTVSTYEHERDRALTLLQHLLMLYLDKLKIVMGKTQHLFPCLANILGRLIPRCSDPAVVIRQTAIDCVHIIFKIAIKHEGKPTDYQDNMVDAIPTLKARAIKGDPSAMFAVIKDLAKVCCKKVPVDQLTEFLDRLFDGLLDSQSHSSSGTCVVLNNMLKARGGELHAQVERLLKCLHDKLEVVTNSQTHTGILRCVRTLASHHLLTVLTALLAYPLPYAQSTVDCWHTFGEDQLVTTSLLDQLLELLSHSLPYEEKPAERDQKTITRIAMQTPIAATCALCEVFSTAESEEPVISSYPRLLGALLVRIASTVGTKAPRITWEEKRESLVGRSKTVSMSRPIDIIPTVTSVMALQRLLERAKCTEFLESLEKEDVWEKLVHEEDYPKGFTSVAKCLSSTQPHYVSKVISYVTPIMASVYEPQRIMVAALFAELIQQQCAGDTALVEMLMNTLLTRLADPSHKVRMFCIRGLGNIASGGPEEVQKYSTTVLSAMMTGMDDKDDVEDDITLEAMSGLSRVLASIDESHVRAILINISLKIRPCFEKEKEAVRAASFQLFGDLARFGDGPSHDPFLEQVHSNLVSILLHLNDEERSVRKACRHSLRQLGPLMQSEPLNTMFQKHLVDATVLHYGEFMNDLTKVLIKEYPEKLNFYIMSNITFFRSTSPIIKSNAVMVTGFLLGNMDKSSYTILSKEHIGSAMVMLLKESEPEVRIKAAEAMSRLHNF